MNPHSKVIAVDNDPTMPVSYRMTIMDADEPDCSIVSFQASTPFGAVSKGDRLFTTSWRVNSEGRAMTISTVAHNIWEGDSTIHHQTVVFARWDGCPPDRKPIPKK